MFKDIQDAVDTTASLWEIIRPKCRVAIYSSDDQLVFEISNISKKPIYIHYVAGSWKEHWYDRKQSAVYLPTKTPCNTEDSLTIAPDRNLCICVPRLALADHLIGEGVSPKVRLHALFRDERQEIHLSRAYWQTLGEMVQGNNPFPGK